MAMSFLGNYVYDNDNKPRSQRLYCGNIARKDVFEKLSLQMLHAFRLFYLNQDTMLTYIKEKKLFHLPYMASSYTMWNNCVHVIG